MKSVCIYFVMVFFVLACQPAEYKNFKVFPKEVFLVANIIETPQVLMKPMEVLILDEAVIVKDFKADHFFHVFSNPGLKYLGSQVRRGRGPGEEIFIHPGIQKTLGNSFFYQTMNGLNTISFSTENQELQIVESIILPSNFTFFDFQDLFKISDLYFGSHDPRRVSRRSEFIGFCPKENRIFEFGTGFPNFERRLTFEQKKQLSANVVSVRPDNKKFASAFLLFPFIRIYNAHNGQLKTEIRFENNQQFPEGFIMGSPTNQELSMIMNNYRAVKSTNNFIYALYVGKTNQDLSYDWNDLAAFGNHSNEIHVFSWEGEPVKRILLDRAIFSFDVTHDDRTLIASSIDSMDELFKYSLAWD